MTTEETPVSVKAEFEPPSPLAVGDGLEALLCDAQRMETVGRLATAMTHEFNDILAAILGGASLLERQLKASGGPHQVASEIGSAAERGAEIVKELLIFGRARPEAGRCIDVASMVEGALPLVQRVLDPSITVQTELRPDCKVTADPGMLCQLVMNLALNAGHAMPHGGTLVIEVEPSPSDPACIELRITDTGVGIAPSDLPHIFEPRFSTRGSRGFGVGLAMVLRIVAQHGGHIGVRSAVSEGTMFRVRLPRTNTPRSVRAPSSRPDAVEARALTILLVEDTEQVRSVIAGMLELCGHRVLQAGSAAGALAHWAEHGERIDLLLSDVLLSGDLDGPALARGLRRTRPELQVILTSGLVVGESAAAQTPGCDYLQKPFGLDELNAILALRFG